MSNPKTKRDYYIRPKNDPKLWLNQYQYNNNYRVSYNGFDVGHEYSYRWGSNPHGFCSIQNAKKILESLLIDRLVYDLDIPVCEIVEQVFVESEQNLYDSRLTVNTALLAKAQSLDYSREFLYSYEQSLRYVQKKELWSHCVRRSGGKALVEEQFGHRAYTNGFYSFFSNDDDVLVAKLLLDDYFKEIIDLQPVNAVLAKLI